MRVDEAEGKRLAAYARAVIAEALGGDRASKPHSPAIDEEGATFVTLRRRDGDLHGCIGALEAQRTIVDDVAKNAVAAALYDPRAPVITLRDVAELDVEVSLLSRLEPIEFDGTEGGAVRALVPFRDGVVLELGHRRGTFLPQVWETLPRPTDFLEHLKEKAGLAKTFWSPDIRLSRYTSRKWLDRAS